MIHEDPEAQIQGGRVFRKVSLHNWPMFMFFFRYAFSPLL